MALISGGTGTASAKSCARAGLMTEHKSGIEMARADTRRCILVISIQLLNNCRYCTFVLNYIDNVRDIGKRSGVVDIQRIRQTPAAACVDITRQYLRLDLSVIEKCSG